MSFINKLFKKESHPSGLKKMSLREVTEKEEELRFKLESLESLRRCCSSGSGITLKPRGLYGEVTLNKSKNERLFKKVYQVIIEEIEAHTHEYNELEGLMK